MNLNALYPSTQRLCCFGNVLASAGYIRTKKTAFGRTLPRFRQPRVHHQRVFLLDAALPFDSEHRKKVALENDFKLQIGIVGFGNFGQFLAKRMIQQGQQVIISATSRRDYSTEAAMMGVTFYTDPNDFAESHPDVVIFSTSIICLDTIMKEFPFHRLRRSTLVVDVLSVKQFPKNLMLSILPTEMDLLCTHPMFGPDSGTGSWDNLPFMYEQVRIHNEKARKERVEAFLDIFREEGCNMIEMPCEEHDRQTASTQFITHTIGRVLGEMELERTDLDTSGFRSLLSLVDNTAHDSFDLYYGLFMYNSNATEEIDRLERAFEGVKKGLFHRLHEIARKKLLNVDDIKSAPKHDENDQKITSLSKSNGYKDNMDKHIK